MNRHGINRISALAAIGLPLVAFLDVLLVVATGWERNLADEGAAAHIFQLLITLDAPVIVAFLATANWHRFMQVARMVGLQATALGLALGSVACFHL